MRTFEIPQHAHVIIHVFERDPDRQIAPAVERPERKVLMPRHLDRADRLEEADVLNEHRLRHFHQIDCRPGNPRRGDEFHHRRIAKRGAVVKHQHRRIDFRAVRPAQEAAVGNGQQQLANPRAVFLAEKTGQRRPAFLMQASDLLFGYRIGRIETRDHRRWWNSHVTISAFWLAMASSIMRAARAGIQACACAVEQGPPVNQKRTHVYSLCCLPRTGLL